MPPATHRSFGILTSFVLLIVAATFPAWASPQPPSPPAYGLRLEQAWIPMPDGVRLAASLFMPDGAKPAEKFPVLLEYLPYRKDDGTAAGDYPTHSYFVRRAYVTARVDIRGTGRSEGQTPEREYSQQEQKDGLEVIAWLARQPWSNGSVGMFGISWGGFNSIQLAMRNPPALKAIIAVCATEALFTEDVHYIDGIIHVDEFEVFMDLDTAISRAPDFPIYDKTLATRFDNPPWSLSYMRHQRFSDFWTEPVRPLESIKIPVFLIGGMLDGYRDSMLRILEQVKAPVKALIGPWNHTYPYDAVPGPAIEWRDQALRWWDHWLKGRDTGIMQEPPIAVYMQHWHPPDLDLKEIPGEWRSEPRWPPPETQQQTLYLQPDHSLGPSAGPPDTHQLKYVPSAGVEIGFWWGDLTPDQRPADAFSLVYDSPPLTEEKAILGRPKVYFRSSVTAPLANWFVRLSDVAPDGTVTLVTGAALDGAQRDSARNPTDLIPGRVYPLEVELHLTSWVFPRGHRIRLAISNAMWPTMWPTPVNMTMSLYLGGEQPSRLLLPTVPLHSQTQPQFAKPEPMEHLVGIDARGGTWPGEFSVTRDQARQATRVRWSGWDGVDFPWGKKKHTEELIYDIQDAHPETNSVEGNAETRFELRGRILTWRGHLQMRSDLKNFYYAYTRELLQNGRVIRTRKWQETIPRDHQ